MLWRHAVAGFAFTRNASRAICGDGPRHPLVRRRTLHPSHSFAEATGSRSHGRASAAVEGRPMRSATALVLITLIGAMFVPRFAAAQTVTWNSVQVSWTAPGDDSLTGTASQYDLRYST